MESILSTLQRLEARLDASDRRWAMVPFPPLPIQSAAEHQQLHGNFQGRVHGFNSLGAAPQHSAFTHTSSWDPPLMRMGADFNGHRSSWEQSASRGPSSTRGPSSLYEFDPILGRPLTSWDLPRPRIAPESCSNRSNWDYWVPPTYSESYGGGGGYSNNYNDYYNHEPPMQHYTYESDRYNPVLQPVQYEPLPPAQYYSVAELPPQQQHYYSPPPSYNHLPDVDATLETDVNDSETRVDARGDEILVDPPLEAIGEEESTPMADSKLEVADADAGYEQQLSELRADPNAAERVLDEIMKPIDDPQTVVNNRNKALILHGSWGESSNALHYLSIDEETHQSLQSRGVRFAVRDEESLALIIAPAQLLEASQPNATRGHQLHFDGNGPMLSPLPSSAKFRKGGVVDFAYEKRARSNRHGAGGNTLRVSFAQPRRSWRNEDQRNVGLAENGNGSDSRELSFGSRRLVIFGIYALEEVYKIY